MTTDGVWIGSPPLLKLELQSTAIAIGEAALQALNASQVGVPHPKQDQWKEVAAPLLRLAGVKSWKPFMIDAQCLSLTSDRDLLKLIPYQNLGQKDGFVPVPEKTIELSCQASPEQVGSAILELLT